MAVKNLTPMALATSAVREWCHRLLTPEVTKKDVLSHMKPSEKSSAERELDWSVSKFRIIWSMRHAMAQDGFYRNVTLMASPADWSLTEKKARDICRSFAKEAHHDDCKRDVRRWIVQEVMRK